MEIWEILDNNGNKTGKTMQKDDEKVWQKGIYHRGADVWIINSEKKILIQKRAKEKKLEPNVWAMTGGSVIKGAKHEKNQNHISNTHTNVDEYNILLFKSTRR